MRSDARAEVLILLARGLCEAVALVAVSAVLHTVAAAYAAFDLLPATAGALGATLVLTALMRDRGTARRSAALTAIVIGGVVAWSLTLPWRSPDALGVLSRIVGFGVIGEVYLWRVVDLARAPVRWRDARGGAALALVAVGIAALAPGPLDHGPLPALALAVASAGAVAMSLSRAVEELSLGTYQIVGRAGRTAATGAAFAIGVLAIAAAALLPAVQALLAEAGRAIGPVLSNVLFAILLPLGYVAAWFVYLVLWLRDAFGIGEFKLPEMPRSPFADQDELERRLREIEEQRPIVFGAIEVFVALIVLAVAVVIVARLMEERRDRVPLGVILEREETEGIGLGATLRLLAPRRRVRPRPPADDGTTAGRIRRMYWRLLDLAEKQGPGRRAPAETPAEHERRLLQADPRWHDASEIVRAFEDVRYGEVQPDAAMVARAQAALGRVEAGT